MKKSLIFLKDLREIMDVLLSSQRLFQISRMLIIAGTRAGPHDSQSHQTIHFEIYEFIHRGYVNQFHRCDTTSS